MARKGKKKPISLAFVPSHIELATAQVQNPDWRPEREGERAFPRQVSAAINVKESSIATLAHKGLIDPAQTAAADRFRRLFEAAGGTGAPAMDMTKDVVDGGKAVQDITESRQAAAMELRKARVLLGTRGYWLVRSIAGERRSIHEMVKTRREREVHLTMLRTHLSDLAEMWGFKNKAGRKVA